MTNKFYPIVGEKNKLSPKLQKISRDCILGRKSIFIKELRMTIFTKANETEKQTRERYLKNSFYGNFKN